MPKVHRFPQLLVTHVVSLAAPAHRVGMPPFPTGKVPPRYFWKSQQRHHIARKPRCSWFFHPPHEVTSHVSLREAPSWWPCSQYPLGEHHSDQSPSQRRQGASTVQGMRTESRGPSTFFTWTWKQPDVWVWKQTHLLHPQDNLDLEVTWGNSHACGHFPVSSLCLQHLLFAVQALSHPPKEPVRLLYLTPIYRQRGWYLGRFRTPPTSPFTFFK